MVTGWSQWGQLRVVVCSNGPARRSPAAPTASAAVQQLRVSSSISSPWTSLRKPETEADRTTTAAAITTFVTTYQAAAATAPTIAHAGAEELREELFERIAVWFPHRDIKPPSRWCRQDHDLRLRG